MRSIGTCVKCDLVRNVLGLLAKISLVSIRYTSAWIVQRDDCDHECLLMSTKGYHSVLCTVTYMMSIGKSQTQLIV